MAAPRKAPTSDSKPDLSGFELFVSLNPECPAPVSRFGSRGFIAARRDPSNPREIQYDTKQVVAISVEEYRRFRHEYNDALASTHLLKRTEEDYVKALDAEAKEQEALQAEAKKRKEAAKVLPGKLPAEHALPPTSNELREAPGTLTTPVHVPGNVLEETDNASVNADRTGD